MKSFAIVSSIAALVVLLTSTPGQAQQVAPQAPADIGARFTYQGRLVKNGQAVNGACAMNFGLYDAVAGGSQVSSTIALPSVVITAGLFTVGLDFGAVFTGAQRWLATEVKCSGDASFAALQPRQELTPAPYAMYSSSTGSLQAIRVVFPAGIRQFIHLIIHRSFRNIGISKAIENKKT